MVMILEDAPPKEWGGNPVEKTDKAIVISDDQLNDSSDLIEAKLLIGKLEIACEKALRLRGLAAAINDPLALEGEKRDLRNRYIEIEAELRKVIGEATAFRRKNK